MGASCAVFSRIHGRLISMIFPTPLSQLSFLSVRIGLTKQTMTLNSAWIGISERRKFTPPWKLKQCKDAKATRQDLASDKLMNGSFPFMGHVWTLLFNSVLDAGFVVDLWKSATVQLLYKGRGPVGDLNNYRGIAFLSPSVQASNRDVEQSCFSVAARHLGQTGHCPGCFSDQKKYSRK